MGLVFGNETRATDPVSDFLSGADVSTTSSAGINVGENKALTFPALFAAVRTISEDIAAFPVHTYANNAQIQNPQWLDKPNPELTRFEFFERMLFSCALLGNAFAVVTRDNRGNPLEFWPVHPEDVEVKRGPEGELWYLIGHKKEPFKPYQLWHLKGPGRPGDLMGLSILKLLREALGLGLAAQDLAGAWFSGQASPSSVIETDNTMSADEMTLVQAKWVAAQGGRRRPAVLPAGLKWKPIMISPEDSQLIQQRLFQTQDVIRVLRIPPHVIGELSHATFSNIEHSQIAYVAHSLRPWLVRVEQSLAKFLPREQYLKFNVDGLLRGDVESRFNAYRAGRETGIFSVNDIRALEDMPPVDNGDSRIQPLNMGPLGGQNEQE